MTDSNNPSGPHDIFFEDLADLSAPGSEGVAAPSRLKSKTYSRLIARMEASGPLMTVHATESTDRLCVFEQLVQITPLTTEIGSTNFCRICHARILAERLENAPIYWSHCPYVRFQNR
jgi:hypothetical protein